VRTLVHHLSENAGGSNTLFGRFSKNLRPTRCLVLQNDRIFSATHVGQLKIPPELSAKTVADKKQPQKLSAKAVADKKRV
jgi:hypothetical protein